MEGHFLSVHMNSLRPHVLSKGPRSLDTRRGAARDFGPHENNLYRAFCIIISSSLGASLGPPPSWAPRIRLLYPPFSAPLIVG